MLVKDLAEALGLEILAGTAGVDKPVKGAYVCDLLSWVMSRLEQGNCWITIQTHVNIIAVAVLGDASCIIIPENAQVDENTLAKADAEGIPLMRSPLNAYQLAQGISELEKKHASIH